MNIEQTTFLNLSKLRQKQQRAQILWSANFRHQLMPVSLIVRFKFDSDMWFLKKIVIDKWLVPDFNMESRRNSFLFLFATDCVQIHFVHQSLL